MEKLKILLLEDNPEEAKDLKAFLEQNDYAITVSKNSLEALQYIRKQVFDVIILDVIIDGKPDGISFAQHIKSEGIDSPFLFLTSVQSRAVFDVAKYTQPITYLLKPYNELELLYTLELALENHLKQANSISIATTNALLSPEFLYIKKNGKVVKIDVDAINYIEVHEKYCSLVCDEGNYLLKLSLLKVKKILKNPYFKQTHRNYLVNEKKIKELYIEDNLIILKSNNKVPLSERYKAAFIKSSLFFK